MPVNISNLVIQARSGLVPSEPDKPSEAASDARNILKSIAADLVTEGRTVRSGYLRIRAEGGQFVMDTQHRWRSGGKTDAKTLTETLFQRAYGGRSDWPEIKRQLTNYLERSGQRFGTRSFMRLMQVLEPDLAVRRSQAGVNGELSQIPLSGLNIQRSRLDLTGLVPNSATVAPVASPEHEIPLGATITSQIEALSAAVGDDAVLEHFQSLASPMNVRAMGVAAVSRHPTTVIGDADGSLCRVAFAAMVSGHLVMSPAAIMDLAVLMKREASLNNSSAGRQAYQADPSVAAAFDRIVAGSRARQSPDGRRLVFIGDLLHDRLSNNKPAMAGMIRALTGDETALGVDQPGVIFILGNHDLPQKPNAGWPSSDRALRSAELQWGSAAARQFGAGADVALINTAFLRAWFDRDSGVFYCHNGIEPLPSGEVRTAVGTFSVTTPVELEASMNLVNLTPQVMVGMTNFRPDEEAMSAARLGSLAQWQGMPVYVVHGHNGSVGVSDRAIHLNARRSGAMSPAAANI